MNTIIYEKKRLEALHEYDILDTPTEEEFDDITKISSKICECPISLITLIEENRQWFKSTVGVGDLKETPRKISFCSVSIETPKIPSVIEDLRTDKRFENNPFVTDEPHVVFYAGVPLLTPEGYPLGTLCVFDTKTRQLEEYQLSTLKALARQVVAQLELRKKVLQLQSTQKKLQKANKDLEDFAYMLSHDFKAPIRTIVSFSTLLKDRINNKLEDDEFRWMDFINNSARNLSHVVDGMLKLAMASDNKLLIKEDINLNVLLEQTIQLLHPPQEFQFHYAETLPSVHTSHIALQQILLNLLSNAIRYNDKELGKVEINFYQDDFSYHFIVTDNGTGIAPEYIEKVFQPLQTLNEKDRFGQKGSGIGLATVMRIIEKLDGNIMVASEVGVGSTFKFKISK